MKMTSISKVSALYDIDITWFIQAVEQNIMFSSKTEHPNVLSTHTIPKLYFTQKLQILRCMRVVWKVSDLNMKIAALVNKS